MPIEQEQLLRFRALFSGLESGHGVYRLSRTRTPGKAQGRATTVREPVTDEKYQAHLEGRLGLGIVPINEQSRCVFGAIDVDIYDLDLPTLASTITQKNLPLVVCRTKSGGCHLYTFLSEPIPAASLRAKLRALAAGLGYGTSEIFPKQDEIDLDRGDLGNWINLPFFNAEETMRYALNETGVPLSFADFLTYAESKRVDALTLGKVSIEHDEEQTYEGPPCLQFLARSKVSEGSRNNGLFNFGVYARKRYQDDWQKKVAEFNERFMHPPLDPGEVQTIIKSLGRKEYEYRCKDEPIVQHCNAELCATRQFGVGSSGKPGLFTALRRHVSDDDVLWDLEVEDHGFIQLSTDDLWNYRAVRKISSAKYKKYLPQLSAKRWESILAQLFRNVADVGIENSLESSTRGQFLDLLEEFCSDRMQGRVIDDILRHKPFTENGRILFHVKDLEDYLRRREFRAYKRGKLSVSIREIGGEPESRMVKGKRLKLWSIPVFTVQDEPHEVPDLGGDVL